MSALTWVRIARRLPGVVRQRELANLEALMDLETGRQPTRNLFILSCAIPAGIGMFGGLSVFVAWLSGNSGLPLVLGTALTAILAAGAWFIFFRMYRAVPLSKRNLRDMIQKLSRLYTGVGNILIGERTLSEAFSILLDEAAGIYLRHASDEGVCSTNTPVRAAEAIEEAMSKLMEVALTKDQLAQDQALVWAQPILEEMRLLSRSISEHALASERSMLADPLANLREARAELETKSTAIQELDQHLGAG